LGKRGAVGEAAVSCCDVCIDGTVPKLYACCLYLFKLCALGESLVYYMQHHISTSTYNKKNYVL
jgi:hypothetical protein